MEAIFLTVKEVAQQLRISPSSVYGLCQRGLLACHRIGSGRGSVRILPADLQAYLNSARREPERNQVIIPERIQPLRDVRVFRHLRPPPSVGP